MVLYCDIKWTVIFNKFTFITKCCFILLRFEEFIFEPNCKIMFFFVVCSSSVLYYVDLWCCASGSVDGDIMMVPCSNLQMISLSNLRNVNCSKNTIKFTTIRLFAIVLTIKGISITSGGLVVTILCVCDNYRNLQPFWIFFLLTSIVGWNPGADTVLKVVR